MSSQKLDVLNEEDIQVFIKGTHSYFTSLTGVEPDIGTPYLSAMEDVPLMDFSAGIGVSGVQKGCIFFTSEQRLIEKIAETYGELSPSEDLLVDMAGEIANTISGNAREELGANFMISVPIVFVGKPDRLGLSQNQPLFVIPITWNECKSCVIVSLSINDQL